MKFKINVILDRQNTDKLIYLDDEDINISYFNFEYASEEVDEMNIENITKELNRIKNTRFIKEIKIKPFEYYGNKE